MWRGAAVATVGTFGIDAILPNQDQKSSLIGSKDAKLGLYLGAVAGIAAGRAEPKVVGYSWGVLAGVMAGDLTYALSGAPRFASFDRATHTTSAG
jgi:hypothetical protein